MLGYVVRRVLLVAVILLLVSLLIFAVVNLLPGDVANAVLGEMATPDQVEAVRQKLGLNVPASERYLRWVTGLLAGDFGTSLSFGTPIGPVLLERLGNSAILAILLLIIVVPLSVALGILAATRQGGLADRVILAVSVAGHALPEFVIGLALILLFSIVFPILPSSSMVPAGASPLGRPIILILPVTVLVLHQLAGLTQIARASTLAALNSNFVRTAMLKGLSRRRVLLRHALPNALPPVVAEVGMSFGYVLGGLVVVETLVAYPGIGQLMVMSVDMRDVPTIQATVLVIAAAYSIGNLFADVLSMVLNPRLREAAA